jgi:NAD+ kinase
VLVVWKRSAYDIYVRQHRSERVQALLDRKDPTVARLLRADEAHARTLEEVHRVVETLGLRGVFRPRDRVGETAGFDLVVCVGGDGTLLAVSHAVAATPVLGINSAPQDSVGHLCGGHGGAVERCLADALEGRLGTTRVARMRVLVDARVVHTRVLNDVLFCHPNPAMTSRYLLSFRGTSEEHKSSGLWVATAVGSTAAIRYAGGRVLPLRSRALQYAARELYDLGGFLRRAGVLRPRDRFEVRNKMREARLYMDGARIVVPVQMGECVRVDTEAEPLALVGIANKDRPR